MNETVISWTVTNWITVFLMVATMALAVGFVGKLIYGKPLEE